MGCAGDDNLIRGMRKCDQEFPQICFTFTVIMLHPGHPYAFASVKVSEELTRDLSIAAIC